MRRLLLTCVAMHVSTVVLMSQTFGIRSIDASQFPTMSAVVQYAAQPPVSSPIAVGDIVITDAGQSVSPQSVTCDLADPEILHLCFILDFKNYEPLIVAGVERIIQQLRMPETDVAILSTYEHVQVIQDFTRDRVTALASARLITTSPGLDLQRAFFSEPNGAIPFVKGRTGRTIVVFISDLHCPQYNLDFNRFQLEATRNRIEVNSILVGTTDYTGIFAQMAAATGGTTRGGVTDSTGFDIAIRNIWSAVYGACTVTWTAPRRCDLRHDVAIRHRSVSTPASTHYTSPVVPDVSWSTTPVYVRMPPSAAGTTLDTTIRLRASVAPVVISSVTASLPGIVITPSSMIIDTGGSTTIRVQWTKQTDATQTAIIRVASESCGEQTIVLVFVGKDDSAAPDPVRLRIPNGGEVYTAGTTAAITYDGVPTTTFVQGRVSVDNGRSWTNVGYGRGGSLPWSVPPTPSDSCLARIDVSPSATLQVVDSALYSRKWTMADRWYVDPQQRHLYMGGPADSLIVYDAKAMVEVARMPYDMDQNVGFGAPDDASYVAFGINGGDVVVLDGYTLAERRRYDLPRTAANPAVSVSLDGTRILVRQNTPNAANHTAVTVLDSNGTTLYDSLISAFDVSMHPAGTMIATAGYEEAMVIDVATRRSHVYDAGPYREWSKATFSHDGSKVAFTTRAANSVRGPAVLMVVDAVTGEQIYRDSSGSPEKVNELHDVQWTPDDRRVVACGSHVISVDLGNRAVIGYDSADFMTARSAAVSPNGEFVAYYRYLYGDSIFISTVVGLAPIAAVRSRRSNSGGHRGQQWSPSGRHLYVGLSGMPYNIYRYAFDLSAASPTGDVSDSLWRIIAPRVDLNTLRIDMGTVPLGVTKDSTVRAVLCNNGNAPLQVTGIDISSGNRGDFNIPVGGGEFSLAPGECRDILVEFMPMAEGYREARATIKTTIGSLADTLILTGNGVRDRMEIVADAIDFGRLPIGVSRDTANTAILRNRSTAPVTIRSAVLAGPDASSFSALDLPTGAPIGIDSLLRCGLRFTATRAGRHSAWIEVRHDGPLGFVRVHVFGEGVASVPVVLGADTIMSQCVATVDTSIRVTNIGEGRMIISAVTMRSLDGSNALRLPTQLVVPISIWPGDTLEIPIRFRPSQAGTYRAECWLVGDAGDTIRIPLTGTSLPNDIVGHMRSVRLVSAPGVTVIDTAVSVDVVSASGVELTASTSSADIVFTGPITVQVPPGTSTVWFNVRCSVPLADSVMGDVVVRASTCPGDITIPITVLSASRPPTADTIHISVPHIRTRVGEEFTLRTVITASPGVWTRLPPTAFVTTSFNASMMLPMHSQGALMLTGVQALMQTSVPTGFDVPMPLFVDVPYRALLGTDSVAAIVPGVIVADSSIVVVVDTGSITLLDLCEDGGRLRGFDPMDRAVVRATREGGIIRVTVEGRHEHVDVRLMDLRGAVIPADVQYQRSASSTAIDVDLRMAARGRLTVLVYVDDRVTSIPILHH